MKLRRLLGISVTAASLLGIAACAPVPPAGAPAAAPGEATEVASVPPTAAPEATTDPYRGWSTYLHPATGLSLRYPTGWFGPEVYEFDGGVRIEVGSDTVYPYGTGLDERQPGAPNAYNIVIQYTLNPSGWALEQYRAEQPWLNDSLAVIELQDGESISTARSVTQRVRGLTVGRYDGVEYTTTLAEGAQTERYFTRSAFLMDEALNVITVIGQPVNVEVADPSTWREVFAALDAGQEATFRAVVDSIQVP